MIAEDVQRVRSYATGGNMYNAGEKLACHFIHIGDHKKQALRSGVCGGKSACGKRAVYGTRGTRLGLHLDHFYSFTENVACGLAEQVFVGSRPCVGDLCHGA